MQTLMFNGDFDVSYYDSHVHIAVVEEAALDRISPIVISLPHFSQSLVDW